MHEIFRNLSLSDKTFIVYSDFNFLAYNIKTTYSIYLYIFKTSPTFPTHYNGNPERQQLFRPKHICNQFSMKIFLNTLTSTNLLLSVYLLCPHQNKKSKREFSCISRLDYVIVFQLRQRLNLSFQFSFYRIVFVVLLSFMIVSNQFFSNIINLNHLVILKINISNTSSRNLVSKMALDLA